MKEIIQIFKDNSEWIKDFFSLIFTGTATVVTVLAYRRAKATVLQPKRTEVIKIQTQVLTDFLKSISENGNSIDSALDYLGVFNCNVYFNIWRTDVEFSKISELFEEMNTKIAGCYTINQGRSNATQLKGNLEDIMFYVKTQKTDSLVVLTNEALTVINCIRELSMNPFIPDEINEIVHDIFKDLSYNYFELMPNFCQLTKSIIDKGKFNNISNFNEFEKQRRHHGSSFEKLKQKIREHLGVNDKW